MIRKFLFCLTIAISLISCKDGSDSFSNWIKKNQGQKFTTEKMNELIAAYGNPTDSSNAASDTVIGFNINYFYGPFFDATESKQIIEIASKEWNDIDALYRNYENRSTTDQGTSEDQSTTDDQIASDEQSLNEQKSPSEQLFIDENYTYRDMSYNGEEHKKSIAAYNEKYEKLYQDRTNGKTFTLGEMLASYQKKFPKLTKKDCLDSLKTFNLQSTGNVGDIGKKIYTFCVDKSVSYKRTFEIKSDIQDFKVKIFSDIVIAEDGTIAPYESMADGYCITDESKKDLSEKIMRYDWVYESGGSLIGAIKFNSDGTYSMSNKLFGGNHKEGNWGISCSGDIEASNNSSFTLTKDGIKIGQTLYKSK
jgi:hypothetical protein